MDRGSMGSELAQKLADQYHFHITSVLRSGKVRYSCYYKGHRIGKSLWDTDAEPILKQIREEMNEEKYEIVPRNTFIEKKKIHQKEEDNVTEEQMPREDNIKSDNSDDSEKERPAKEIIQEFAQEVKDRIDDAKPNEKQTKTNAANLSVLYPRLASLKDLKIPIGKDKYLGQSIFILGQSHISGKTTLAANIYKTYFADKDFITILFASNPQNPIYRQFGNAIQFDSFLPWIPKMIKDINRATNNYYRFLLIIDDVVDQRDSSAIRDLVLTMRNANVYSMVLAQYPTLFAKGVRSNFKYIFLGAYNRADGVDSIPTILPSLPGIKGQKTKDQRVAKFENYKKLTSDHKWVVIDSDGKEWSYQSKI